MSVCPAAIDIAHSSCAAIAFRSQARQKWLLSYCQANRAVTFAVRARGEEALSTKFLVVLSVLFCPLSSISLVFRHQKV